MGEIRCDANDKIGERTKKERKKERTNTCVKHILFFSFVFVYLLPIL